MRNATVCAFEPEALNYAELNKNIFLNNLHDRVLAYCLALSDVNKVDRLLLSDFGIGISYHDFEENSWTEDKAFAEDWVVSKDNRRQQGCIGRTVDSLIAKSLSSSRSALSTDERETIAKHLIHGDHRGKWPCQTKIAEPIPGCQASQ